MKLYGENEVLHAVYSEASFFFILYSIFWIAHWTSRHHEMKQFCQRLMLLSGQLAALHIDALMVIFVQLHKHHFPQWEDQAVSSVKSINRLPNCFAQSGRPQTILFNLMLSEKATAALLLRAATMKQEAAQQQSSQCQASLKPALLSKIMNIVAFPSGRFLKKIDLQTVKYTLTLNRSNFYLENENHAAKCLVTIICDCCQPWQVPV